MLEKLAFNPAEEDADQQIQDQDSSLKNSESYQNMDFDIKNISKILPEIR